MAKSPNKLAGLTSGGYLRPFTASQARRAGVRRCPCGETGGAVRRVYFPIRA